MPRVVDLEKRQLAPAGTYVSGLVRQGEVLRITDVAGGQVGDFVAVNHADPDEHLDCAYTNWANMRWRWQQGATLFTNRMNRMWVIKDDPTGVHFTGGGFCSNDARRLFLDPEDTTPGCRDCLERAFLEQGLQPHQLRSTSCISLFMNVDYSAEGEWITHPPVTKAGDYIDLRAEMDIFWALSVCVFPGVNDGPPSALQVDILVRSD